jgi:hypothetical protein
MVLALLNRVMDRINPETEAKLLKIRKAALEKRTWQSKFLTEKESALLLARLLPQTNSLPLVEALKNELRTRPLYDAVASWCDTQIGLASQFPEQILQIASGILPLENEGDSAGN